MQLNQIQALLRVCLLSCTLIGVAQTAATNSTPVLPLWCYLGFHTTITPTFPLGYGTCISSSSCYELRYNWTYGLELVSMGCGNCNNESPELEYRECKTNGCNKEFGSALAPVIRQLKYCYVSAEDEIGIKLHAVLCPLNQTCSMGTSPALNITMSGCQAHCEKRNWTDCRYCDGHLCNQGDVLKLEDSDISPDAKPIGLARIDIASDEVVSGSSPLARPTIELALLAAAAVLAVRPSSWLSKPDG